MYHEVSNIVCFQTFSVKRKKTICIENIRFQGALRKIHLVLQFHRYNKIYDFISFTKTRSRALQCQFLNYCKKKIRKIFTKKIVPDFTFSYNCLFILCCFYWKQMENGKTKTVAVSVIQFPIKRCLFQPSRSKTVGEETYLAAKSVIFQEKVKTHYNTTT